MWRKKLHDEIGYFSEEFRSAGDYEFWCRIGCRYPMMHLKQFLGVYYENPRGFANSDIELSARESAQIKLKYRTAFPIPRGDYTCNFQFSGSIGENEYVHICIVVNNVANNLPEVLESVLRYTEFPHVITVVTVGCTVETRKFLALAKETGWITNLMVLDETKSVLEAFSSVAALEPKASYRLCLGSSITIALPGWLTLLVREAERFTAVRTFTNRIWSRDKTVRTMDGILPAFSMDDEPSTCFWFERNDSAATL
jgi:hypothetical protein